MVVDEKSDELMLAVGVRVGEGIIPRSGHNGILSRTSNGNEYPKLFMNISSMFLVNSTIN